MITYTSLKTDLELQGC